MKKIGFAAGLVLFFALGVVSAQAQIGCDGPHSVWTELKSDTVYVHHDSAVFNCCPVMEYETVRDGDIIDIYENEIIGECDCICCFDLVHMLVDLEPGTYTVRVWGAYQCEGEPCGEAIFTVGGEEGDLSIKNYMSNCGGDWSAAEELPFLNDERRLSEISGNLAVGSAAIRYVLEKESNVTLKIFDVTGSRVLTVDMGTAKEGEHEFVWDCTNDEGEKVRKGSYFVRLETQDASLTLPVLVIQ